MLCDPGQVTSFLWAWKIRSKVYGFSCSNPSSSFPPSPHETQFNFIKLCFNAWCLAGKGQNSRPICCLSFTGKKPVFSDKVSCFPVCLCLFSFWSYLVSCLYSLESAEATHASASSLLSCSPRPKQEGECSVVSEGGNWSTWDSGLCLTHPFSQLCRPLGDHLPKIPKPPLPPTSERHDRGSPLPGKKPPVPR